MNYSQLVEQTRKELEKASDTTAILTDMYNKAKENYIQSHKAATEELNYDLDTKKNAAAALKKQEEKNTGEFLASRGLAFSGESAQAKLNSDMAFANTVSALDDQHTKAVSRLNSEKNKNLFELDTEYAEKRMKASKELDEQAEKAAQNKIKYGEVTLQDVTNADGTGNVEGDGLFEPSMTAYQLANAIVKRYGTGGKVSAPEQSLNIHTYLDGLKERYSFTDDYIDKLNFALDAMGYTASDDSGMRLTDIVNNANLYYENSYDRNRAIAKKIYMGIDDRTEYAEKRAAADRLDYIYRRCKTLPEFYTACAMLGMTKKEISNYMNTVYLRSGTPNQVDMGVID